MRQLLKLLFASAAISAPTAVQGQFVGGTAPVVAIAKSEFYRDGTCAFQLELTNADARTIKVIGEVFLVTSDKVSLGSLLVEFPPTVPGGKSKAVAGFPASRLAARCSRPLAVVIQPRLCSFADGTSLRPNLCGVQQEMIIGR